MGPNFNSYHIFQSVIIDGLLLLLTYFRPAYAILGKRRKSLNFTDYPSNNCCSCCSHTISTVTTCSKDESDAANTFSRAFTGLYSGIPSQGPIPKSRDLTTNLAKLVLALQLHHLLLVCTVSVCCITGVPNLSSEGATSSQCNIFWGRSKKFKLKWCAVSPVNFH